VLTILPASVALHQIPNGLGYLAQWEGPVDDRGDLAGFDELPQDLQACVPATARQQHHSSAFRPAGRQPRRPRQQPSPSSWQKPLCGQTGA